MKQYGHLRPFGDYEYIDPANIDTIWAERLYDDFDETRFGSKVRVSVVFKASGFKSHITIPCEGEVTDEAVQQCLLEVLTDLYS